VLSLPPPLTAWLILDFSAFFTLVAPHFFGQHDSPSNLAESRYPRCRWKWLQKNAFSGGYRESARLLGESWWRKIEGPFGEKIAQKSRNSWNVNGRGCRCIRTVDLGPISAQFWNQMQTLKHVFCCHKYCVHVCTHVYRTVIASRVVSSSSGRNRIWRRFRVFCLLSVKVCSWY